MDIDKERAAFFEWFAENGSQYASLKKAQDPFCAGYRAALANQGEKPYAWINAGTSRQDTINASLYIGPENPWVETANAFPVYTAPPAAVPAPDRVAQANRAAMTSYALATQVNDLAAITRRLLHALNYHNPGNHMAKVAAEYLKRNNLQGSPLRAEDVLRDEAAAPAQAADAHGIKTWRERHQQDTIGVQPPMHHAELEIAELRAALAAQPAAPENLPVVLELPEGDTRTARVVWQEVKDGKRHLCIAVDGAAPAGEPVATNGEIYTLRRLIECAEELNKRPRPMCRDCADEDGTCPTSKLECDMRKLFADAKALHNKLAAPVANAGQAQVDSPAAADVGGLPWVSVADHLPQAIDAGDGTHPCDPIDSVICAIWRGEWLQAWAKQRYCADGNWRQGDSIGFVPTHWMPLPPAPEDAAPLPQQVAQTEAGNPASKFQIGDHVRKTKGSQWTGHVVGTYSTALTPEGYAVESSTEHGSVQIYPAAALELVEQKP